MSDQPTLEHLALQLVDAEADADAATQRVSMLKDSIRNHPDIHGPDKYGAGVHTVTVSSNRRFDAKKAEELCPPDLLPLVSVTKTTVDRAKFEALCAPLVDACTTTYDDKVSIR